MTTDTPPTQPSREVIERASRAIRALYAKKGGWEESMLVPALREEIARLCFAEFVYCGVPPGEVITPFSRPPQPGT